MAYEPQSLTRRDFAEIVESLAGFWGARDVRHLHHPTAVEEFGDSALVIHDNQGRVAAYLLGMILSTRRLGYVHVVAVRTDERAKGHARRLYQAFTDLAIAAGCTEIKAITTPNNSASIAFHESIGMRGKEVGDYAGPGQPRIVFTRHLLNPITSIHPPVEAVELRTATGADIDEIVRFWEQSAEDTARPTDRRDAVQALIDRDTNALLLAVLNDRIIGSVIAGWDGWRAHIYRLAVYPDHRRQGLGRWLLQVAELHLRDAGAIRIDAMVLDSNNLGQQLWSATGYRAQRDWSRWIKPLG